MALRPLGQDEIDRVATDKEMHSHGANRTICEVIRLIFQEAESLGKTDIMKLCREALTMAKRMDKALKDHK